MSSTARAGQKSIAISQIRRPDWMVETCERCTSDAEHQRYVRGFIETFRREGVQIPINVVDLGRKGDGPFEAVDGRHRLDAIDSIRFDNPQAFKVVPATVGRGDAQDRLYRQVALNADRRVFQPLEYTRVISELLAVNPELTQKDIAERLGHAQSWVSQMLDLGDLHPPVKNALRAEHISVAAALQIGKLPEERQAQALKETIEEAKQGGGRPSAERVRRANGVERKPRSVLRKKEIEALLEVERTAIETGRTATNYKKDVDFWHRGARDAYLQVLRMDTVETIVE